MKTLLIAPTVDTCYERVPNIGLMNLFLIGKELGCDMELMDLTEVAYRKGLQMVLEREHDVIGISCNFTNAVPYCINYIKDIKKKFPETIIISGGNHATLVPEDLLFNGCDYIVCGEGELTFKEVLQKLLKKETLSGLDGLCYLNNGEIVRNSARELIKDLDSLPLNDYSYFNLEPYFKRSGLRYISMETSRGCYYNCAFCSTVKMWGNNYRHKSPERILEEFKIANNLKLDFIFIEDDDIALDEPHLRASCELLIKENIIIPWGTTIGSRSIKNESTIDLLAKSGCVKVNVCIESANSRILKACRKPHTVEDNKKLCLNLLKRKILVHNHGIIGFPDESYAEILRTYFYLIKTSPMWHISILEPRPGSDYWNKWDKQHDVSQYRLFGKANIIISKNKLLTYIIYRLFVLFYLLNPTRIWRALFIKDKGMRYNYRIHYFVAYRTIKENLLIFCQKLLNNLHA